MSNNNNNNNTDSTIQPNNNNTTTITTTSDDQQQQESLTTTTTTTNNSNTITNNNNNNTSSTIINNKQEDEQEELNQINPSSLHLTTTTTNNSNNNNNIHNNIISPIKYTTDLFCKQYTELFIKSTNQKEIQEEKFLQIENLIEILLKKCDEMGENLDLIQSNSIQINDELLPNLLKLMLNLKQIYSKIDNLNLIVVNAKDKINLLDLKLNEFEKQKSNEKYKFVSSFFKFGKSNENNENNGNTSIQFNKDDYLL